MHKTIILKQQWISNLNLEKSESWKTFKSTADEISEQKMLQWFQEKLLLDHDGVQQTFYVFKSMF